MANSVFAALCLAILASTTFPVMADTTGIRWGISAQQRKLAEVVIPKFDLERVPLREALDVLGVQIKSESGDKFTPNFIVRDLNASFKNKAVTLRLHKIPADVLLQYIANQVGGKIRYDKYAIIIAPRK